jgi:hypothetical protein
MSRTFHSSLCSPLAIASRGAGKRKKAASFDEQTMTELPRDRYTWPGRELDADVVLKYNWAVCYDPSIGRLLPDEAAGFDADDAAPSVDR